MTRSAKQNVLENKKNILKIGRKLELWEIVLLVLGSPIWGSLLISVLAIIFSIYIALWSVVISLWAVFVSILCSAFTCIGVGIAFSFSSKFISGLFMIGSGFVLAGLSIFLFLACRFITKGLLKLTKSICVWIKKKTLRGGWNE